MSIIIPICKTYRNFTNDIENVNKLLTYIINNKNLEYVIIQTRVPDFKHYRRLSEQKSADILSVCDENIIKKIRHRDFELFKFEDNILSAKTNFLISYCYFDINLIYQ